VTQLRDRVDSLAADIGEARRAAGGRFAAAVTAELAALGMGGARVEVAVTPLPQPGPAGADEVTLLLSAHAGAPAQPLAQAASGGELSRVMLAIEVVLAGADPVPTMVFDEVDAGVGGRAAVEVGRRLARLARTAQVVVVTHLPQVAAFADHHLCVVKDEAGAVTSSGVALLDDAGRVRELARMLAGQEDSATALAHAEELLAAAHRH
jgi:DNA repair protein RecN (Recombination protein N)